MKKDTQTAQDKTLTTSEKKLSFNQAQIKLIKDTVAHGLTDPEFNLFMYHATRTGMNPLARQIYPLKIQGRMATQISIDGFRVIAERSREYAGQDEPIFEENGTVIKKCTVKVYRWHGDQRYQAAVGVAYFSEYKKNTPTWQTMPHTMIAKVAEALALRKAFPQDLSGFYTEEEIEQGNGKSTSIKDFKESQNKEAVNGNVVDQETEQMNEEIERGLETDKKTAVEDSIMPDKATETKKTAVTEDKERLATPGQIVLLGQFVKTGKLKLTDEELQKMPFSKAQVLIGGVK